MSTLLSENARRGRPESRSSAQLLARLDAGSVAVRSEYDPNTRERRRHGTIVCHCCIYCMAGKPDVLTGGREGAKRCGAVAPVRRWAAGRGRARAEGSRGQESASGPSRDCRVGEKRVGRGCPSWDIRARSATTRFADWLPVLRTPRRGVPPGPGPRQPASVRASFP